MLLGTVCSVLAVAVASGSFRMVIGRVAVSGFVAAAGAGAALGLIESDPIIFAIAGFLAAAAEITPWRWMDAAQERAGRTGIEPTSVVRSCLEVR